MPLPGNRPGARPSLAQRRSIQKPHQPTRPNTILPSSRPSKPSAHRIKKPTPLASLRPNHGDRPGHQTPEKPSISRPGKPHSAAQRPQQPLASRPQKPAIPNDANPGNRPGGGSSGNRPGLTQGPGNRPGHGQENQARPGNRPGLGQPGHGNRPGQRPGIGQRPGQGNHPGLAQRPGNHNPGHNRPGLGNRPGNRPSWANRPIHRPPFNRPGYGQRPGHGDRKPWWNPAHRPGGGHHPYHGINHNFLHSPNWATWHGYWGYNPWWCRPVCRPWYCGTWPCVWRPGYAYSYPYWPGYCVGPVVGWGIAAWSLGTLAYDSGYYSYYNPYPTTEIYISEGEAYDYSEPITRLSTETAPASDTQVAEITEQSETWIEKSQAAFRRHDYLASLDYATKAVEEAPGDGALHEYRALVLFALGKYQDAAGVLHPVLASGPGWDWKTMVKLYDSRQTYTGQLRKLEEFTTAHPEAAYAHFLLGYHYMVCGHFEMARQQFDAAAQLEPKDTVAPQLAALASVSAPKDESDAIPSPATNTTTESPKPESPDTAPATPQSATQAPAPPPLPPENLVGSWVADKGKDGKITLDLSPDGTFIWTYQKPDGKPFELKGKFSLDEKNRLTLDAGKSQMVANVTMPEENQMHFVLAAGPPGDPGLVFKKK